MIFTSSFEQAEGEQVLVGAGRDLAPRVEAGADALHGDHPDIWRQELVNLAGNLEPQRVSLHLHFVNLHLHADDRGRAVHAFVGPRRPVPTELGEIAPKVGLDNAASLENRALQLALDGYSHAGTHRNQRPSFSIHMR